MKKYLLFSGSIYHHVEGAYGFTGSFDSIEEAKLSIPITDIGEVWAHIADRDTMKIIVKTQVDLGSDLMPAKWRTEEEFDLWYTSSSAE